MNFEGRILKEEFEPRREEGYEKIKDQKSKCKNTD